MIRSKKTAIIFIFAFLLIARGVFASPQRIVSLKPNITEIIFALGVGDKVVGVTTYCDYPPEAKKLPKVGDYTRPFAEKLIALKPDIVISSEEESSRRSIEDLMGLGIKVALFKFTTLNETIESIKKIGVLVGEVKRGEDLAAQLEAGLDMLSKRYANIEKTRVLLVVSQKPLIVGSPDTYVGGILPTIGAVNVVPAGSVAYPRWSVENVIASNPDVIIDLSMADSSVSREDENNLKKFYSRLDTVKAVKDDEIYFMSVSDFRASHRIFHGAAKLSSAVHPCPCKKRGKK